MARFTGKTVIVTGSSSGIGEAVAKRFSQEGANIVINSRSRGDLEQVAANMPADRTLIVEGDIAEDGFPAQLVSKTVERFGALDVLHNNAGVAVNGPFADASDEDIDKVLSVNVRGLMRMSRAAIPELAKTKGCIVNTSSVSGTGGDFGMAIYNASKGAVTNFTRALALELGAKGIRVNAVNPSITRSEMSSGIFDNDKLMTRFKQRIALGRPGEPEDVAGPVLFLASDDARFVSGVNLPVDGGVSASNGQPNMMALQD
ncbi:3-oxoacyl-ACP reductase [Pacificimonas flava]|uniref:3-oxoacyl-ACP reductase n=2 Tax=Pacificimonas TaxID=1960290 RepID=A0A219B4V1_9SPHN|nr:MULTISPECIES: SDR family oxidoreductase [Pacificimonas]MBZ6377484.1 SDR family oxidoreductase [Pacificimonas aurantium]OWV32819.1 3-oxoacyl-ACP reductase [Pacificimonas flava]